MSPKTRYLSQEWLDDLREAATSQPERPGASARIQYAVSGGPDGEVKYYWILEDGKLLESALGTVDDADITLTLTYEDSVKVQQGDLDANAAFMQGRMKVAGNMAKLMQLLPLTNSPEYKDLQAQVTRATTF
jgi:putative sterol carrier protein